MKEKISFESIVNALAFNSSLSKAAARKLVKEMSALIQEGLLRDGVVKLSGFGVFKLHSVSERQGRNIQTGEAITIPAHRKVIFKPEKHLRKSINKQFDHLKPQLLESENMNSEDKKEDLSPEIPESKLKTDTDESKISNGPDPAPPPVKPAEPESFEKKPEPISKPVTPEPVVVEKKPVLAPESVTSERAAVEKKPDPTPQAVKAEPETVERKPEPPSQPSGPSGPPEKEGEEKSKKVPIIIAIIAVLLIILLYALFGGDDPVEQQAQIVKKPAQVVKKPVKEVISKPPVKKPEIKVVENKRYTTSRGDNLWDIAETNYKEGDLWPLILVANKGKINNPDYLRPKIELLIPILKNPAALDSKEMKQLAEAHLRAYFLYKNAKIRRKAIHHLYEVYMRDKGIIEKTSSKIGARDLKIVKKLVQKN